jgi:hypothetical protein
VLQWNTFLGGAVDDFGYGIAVDGYGNVYVAGESKGSWGDPVRAFTPDKYDCFVAKLDGSGVLLWNTFRATPGTTPAPRSRWTAMAKSTWWTVQPPGAAREWPTGPR